MPLVAQGKFQEYYNEKDRIVEEYNAMHQKYFADDFYNPAYDIFSEFFYEVDCIFFEAWNCRNNIQGLINVAEIKTIKAAEKLQNAYIDLNTVIENCKDDFQKIYDMRKRDGFTPIEIASFENYHIMKFIQW